jgi:hypothetical protein
MPKIRRATLNDLELLSRLSAETFIETFGKNYSENEFNQHKSYFKPSSNSEQLILWFE